MASASPVELRTRYREVMGDELGEAYYALSQDVAWLHAKWSEFEALFLRSSERWALLEATAKQFFRFLRQYLHDDILLQVARLTDPPEQGPKPFLNLTLECLPPLIGDNGLRTTVEEQIASVDLASKSIRDWRNRRLAHNDRALALGDSSKPLPSISPDDVRAVLAAIRTVLNSLEEKYCNATVGYEHVITGPGDADGLVAYLHLGRRAEERRHERLKAGKPRPEDLERDPMP